MPNLPANHNLFAQILVCSRLLLPPRSSYTRIYIIFRATQRQSSPAATTAHIYNIFSFVNNARCLRPNNIHTCIYTIIPQNIYIILSAISLYVWLMLAQVSSFASYYFWEYVMYADIYIDLFFSQDTRVVHNVRVVWGPHGKTRKRQIYNKNYASSAFIYDVLILQSEENSSNTILWPPPYKKTWTEILRHSHRAFPPKMHLQSNRHNWFIFRFMGNSNFILLNDIRLIYEFVYMWTPAIYQGCVIVCRVSSLRLSGGVPFWIWPEAIYTYTLHNNMHIA